MPWPASTSLELVVPGVLLASAILTDSVLPASVMITSAFVLAAFVGSAISTPRRTAALAAACVAAVAASAAWNDNFGSAEWCLRLAGAVVFGAVAVWLAHIRVRRERALQHMTVVAETVQRALLRALPGRVGPVGLAARYVSATEAALVGGDLYEVADTPYGVRVVVGDVRGKGLEAVHLASTVVAAFRRAAYLRPDLEGVACELDLAVATVRGDEDFVTAVLAEYHDDGTASLVNCGHQPPLVVDPEQPARLLDTGVPDVPLGLGSSPEAATVTWPQGRRMLLYTDGLVEARDERGTFFPLDQYADALREASLDDALDRLIGHLAQFSSNHRDDMALVLAEHRPV
jgi:sigma-B regulation protein RsbU (phosphoserine phosphatase)